MANAIDNLTIIGRTMEDILNFVANDEVLSKDFQEYLEINKIEIESEKEFNNVIIQYILDMKMQNGLRVLEYYKRNSATQPEIIEALQNSFCGVFKVNKILSNAYEVDCLTSNAKLTLIPMVKMVHLKQIGRYDYIVGRIIELNEVQYILEIYDIVSEFNVFRATTVAIKYMLENPRSAYYKNDDKRNQLEKSVKEFYQKFNSCFEKQYISTTNKKIDSLIEYFNTYRLEDVKKPFDEYIETVDKYRFLNIEEFNCDDDTFLQNAVGGFSSHKETYDVALWVDKERGLYIIPFFETFLKCFVDEIENKEECIRDFLTNDKIPPSVIKFAMEKNDNFFEVVNNVLNTNFQTIEEVLFNTKTAFIESGVYSPVVVLFNSELFSTLLNIEKEPKENTEKIGRNEPCPCGSGLKYKNCCAKVL